MNAASYFGMNYREAVRKRGEAEGRRRMTMLADDEESGTKVRYRCPECQEMAVMKQMLARAADEDEDEEEVGRRRLAVRCVKCHEDIELEAPRGYRWVSPGSEASVAFGQRYDRVLRERGLRHANVASAMRIG